MNIKYMIQAWLVTSTAKLKITKAAEDAHFAFEKHRKNYKSIKIDALKLTDYTAVKKSHSKTTEIAEKSVHTQNIKHNFNTADTSTI